MRLKIFIFFILITSTVCVGLVIQELISTSQDHGLAQKIDTSIQSIGDFNGGVLIVKDGKIIMSKGYGYADYEHGIPNTSRTRFRIASVTKLFTALAVMQLQEKKLLHVQHQVSQYISGYLNGDNISIHHLLTHTSGIPNYHSRFSDIAHCANLKDMVESVKNWPLEFQPGSKFSYSNTGYLLLAYIIERVSGMPYTEYLYENIFKPLGMSGTHDNSDVLTNHALGYVKESDTIKNVPRINAPKTLLGNGDLSSCLQDMYVWDQALDSGKIITRETFRSIIAPHVMMPGSSQRAVGYGLFIDEYGNKKVIESSGCLRGFLTKYIKYIDDKITIIIMANVEDQKQFDKICECISAIMFS